MANGPVSSVDIATELPSQSGIEYRCGRDFPPGQTGPGAHPDSCKMGYCFFPRGRGGRGVGLNPHPHLVCRGPRKEYSYTSTHPKGISGL